MTELELKIRIAAVTRTISSQAADRHQAAVDLKALRREEEAPDVRILELTFDKSISHGFCFDFLLPKKILP